MRYLAEDIANWPNILPESKLSLTLLLGYVWIEEAGTGGGVFRTLYSRFLKEASDALRNDEISKASQLMMKSANTWADVAKMLFRGSKTSNLNKITSILITAKEKITQSAELEEKAFRQLKTIL